MCFSVSASVFLPDGWPQGRLRNKPPCTTVSGHPSRASRCSAGGEHAGRVPLTQSWSSILGEPGGVLGLSQLSCRLSQDQEIAGKQRYSQGRGEEALCRCYVRGDPCGKRNELLMPSAPGPGMTGRRAERKSPISNSVDNLAPATSPGKHEVALTLICLSSRACH